MRITLFAVERTRTVVRHARPASAEATTPASGVVRRLLRGLGLRRGDLDRARGEAIEPHREGG
jgi:hypothetical protein